MDGHGGMWVWGWSSWCIYAWKRRMQGDQKGMLEKAKWATQFVVSGPKPGPHPFPAKTADVGAHNSSLSRENTRSAGLLRTRCCHAYCGGDKCLPALGVILYCMMIRPSMHWYVPSNFSERNRASPTFSCRPLFANL